MLEGSINLHVKKGGLDAFALSINVGECQKGRSAAPFAECEDRTGIDPRAACPIGSWHRTFMTRVLQSRVCLTIRLVVVNVRSTTPMALRLTLEGEQLNRVWRSQRSLPERLKEDANGQVASEAR